MPGTSLTREAIANWRITPIVRPLKDDLVGGVASTLWVLMGAIGAVLLIACANIANLMLVRADARRQEFAVRAALGAVPARIARELLVESFVLGAAGGVLGLVLAYVGLRGSRCHRPEQPAAPSGDRRLSARARVHRGRFARVDARVRLDHGAQARTAHRYAHDRRRARGEREPRAQRDAQRVGRRAGGARARVGRERGAHDSNVSGAARRRPRFFGPGDDSNGADLDSDSRVFRSRAIHAHAARDPRQDRGASGRRVGRLCEPASDGRSGRTTGPSRSKARRRRRQTRRRRADASSSRPATSKPWARE